MTSILLHGFWGQPKDWNDVLGRLPLGFSVLTPDLYEPGLLAPTSTLTEWSEKFWQWVDSEQGDDPVQLIGYSMGGRLALNALIVQPKRVKRALILSANPLLAKDAYAEREKWETQFSVDFLRKSWSELEIRWQEQSVFAGAKALPRRQSPELREVLGLSLKNWSPRLHPFGVEALRELPASCDWAFGALDQNYQGVAKTLQDVPVQGQITLVPQAGHRLITEAADVVSQWIENGSQQ